MRPSAQTPTCALHQARAGSGCASFCCSSGRCVATAAVVVLAVVAQHQRQTGSWEKRPAAKRNLVFMVSDGMGPASLALTRTFRQLTEGLPIDGHARAGPALLGDEPHAVQQPSGDGLGRRRHGIFVRDEVVQRRHRHAARLFAVRHRAGGGQARRLLDRHGRHYTSVTDATLSAFAKPREAPHAERRDRAAGGGRAPPRPRARPAARRRPLLLPAKLDRSERRRPTAAAGRMPST